MFEIAVPLVSAPGSPRYNGLGDLELSFKHTIVAGQSASGAPHIVAAGVEARMPNGNFEKGAGEGSLIFEPFISAGTMLGNFYLQTQFKVEFPTNREHAERAVLYNAYIGRDTSLSPQTWTIGAEFNGENHEYAITPQVRKGLTGTGALAAAVGATIPINERQERGVRWVGYLLWEYLEPWRARR